jgi:DNA-binding CsgD family transcriptional regulator
MSVVDLVGPCFSHFDAYQQGMNEYDPLNIRRLVNAQKKVAVLRRDQGLASVADFERYRHYMEGSLIADVVDFVFWHDGRPYAGLGVLKTPSDPPFSSESIDFAISMQSYFETNLMTHPTLHRQNLKHCLAARYQLTPREIEHAELICYGLTNRDISDELRIGLGTVKMHVFNIFQKLGVENRAALVSFVTQIK